MPSRGALSGCSHLSVRALRQPDSRGKRRDPRSRHRRNPPTRHGDRKRDLHRRKSGRFAHQYGRTSAAAFFVAPGASDEGFAELIHLGVPIIPVLRQGRMAREIPALFKHLNALDIGKNSIARLVSALLECVSLLPIQRRIFLSYRRTEGREAALQMFDALSERQFEVFLDTHGVPPAADFQFTLWQRLCDSDILIMLDTPGYFASRWNCCRIWAGACKECHCLARRLARHGSLPTHRRG